jgi:fatty acid desaturase
MLKFKYRDGSYWNVAALSYAFVGYLAGLLMLTSRSVAVMALGVFLVAHTLSTLSYFLHELAHGTIFASPSANAALGKVVTWFNGSCFSGFATLRELHLQHHARRTDIVRFDFKAWLRRTLPPLRWSLLALEWLHFPAIEFVMRGHALGAGLRAGGGRRLQMLALLASRVLFFTLLGAISLTATALYFVAYTFFLCFVRFFDAHQHTYQVQFLAEDGQLADRHWPDRSYENGNTYSNLVSRRNRWLNLVCLNFAYHNAHHARPAVAWHGLPDLHRRLYGNDEIQVIPVAQLLWSYHRYRMARLRQSDYGTVSAGPRRAAHFVGAVGVSFLY